MKKYFSVLLLFLVVFLSSCFRDKKNNLSIETSTTNDTAAIKIIKIETPKGTFDIWTKRIGENPTMKVLLLNGGPGLTHEYLECFEKFLPKNGIEIIYYDQLGCGNSSNPNDTSLWDLDRYVEEVEQVRTALHLDKNNFYLFGHSWGGILGMEYAFKYQQHLKGLIISNMMCDGKAYDAYADNVLSKQMPPTVLDTIQQLEAKKDFSNPLYMKLLMEHYYAAHICRIPIDSWPEPINRSFAKLNNSLYVTMQGPSEFGLAGKLTNWDRSKDLHLLKIPVLTVGAKYDTMDPEHMAWMAKQMEKGSYLYSATGSHMAMYDDQVNYFSGLIDFIKKVDNTSH